MRPTHDHAAVLASLAQLEQQWQSPAPQAAALDSKTGYRGAASDKHTQGWQPRLSSGDSMLRADWHLLTARISDLVRNEPSLKKAKTDLVKHIVGQGIHTFADAVDDTGAYLDDWNDESDDWFERWAEEECDVQGRLAWPEVQWHVHDQTIEQGEAILLKCLDNRPGRSLPLCYQLLEASQLDETKDEPGRPGQNRISRGVELDANNRAVAYWIHDAHPYDSHSGWTAASTRIPADRVLHYYLPMQLSATRGVGWFHALVRATRDVDWYLGNELTSSALGALMVGIHKRANMANGLGVGLADGTPDSDAYGNPLVKLGAGVVREIHKDDEFDLVESKRPGRQANEFLKLMRTEQAMGTNLSYITLTGDFSQTSFTSAHGAANEENAYFRPLQGRFSRSLVRPVRREHTAFAVAFGLYRHLGAMQYRRQLHRYRRLLSQGPGRDQLNPLDQSEAANARMRSGQSTLADECAATGKNWRKVLRMKARIEREAERLGTTLDWSKGASMAASTQEVVTVSTTPPSEVE
jgi:lambda family phage portal protein